MSNMIRVGSKIFNLDHMMHIGLDWDDDGISNVVFETTLRGQDELEKGEGMSSPFTHFLEGEEAKAMRAFLEKKVPDISNMIRVGSKIFNLDHMMHIDLDWDDDGISNVVFETTLRGFDRLDEGVGLCDPYVYCLDGEEAKAVRAFLEKKVPDMLEGLNKRTDTIRGHG